MYPNRRQLSAVVMPPLEDCVHVQTKSPYSPLTSQLDTTEDTLDTTEDTLTGIPQQRGLPVENFSGENHEASAVVQWTQEVDVDDLIAKDRKTSQRSVSFDHVEIREYLRILGDHPGTGCTDGPPLAIGWEYDGQATRKVPLEEFEARVLLKRHERSWPQLLDGQQRRNILLWCAGETTDNLDRAEKESQRIRRQRVISKNNFRLEATRRKLKSLAFQYISNYPYT